MDKSWIFESTTSSTFIKGVGDFLDFAFSNAAVGNEISCPCSRCKNENWLERKVVLEHLILKGFDTTYTEWIFHGEDLLSSQSRSNETEGDARNIYDDMEGLIHDTYRANEDLNGPDANTMKFFNLLKEADEVLYPGCEKFSKLSFTIRLYLVKCLHGMSNACFDALMKELREAFPQAKLPESFNHAKNMVKELGLDYKKIHACPNDCMLYWKEDENRESCRVCGVSRWKKSSNVRVDDNVSDSSSKTTKIPDKVLRHFPLIPRLQRLFMSSKISNFMRWHKNERTDDGKLRHPADGEAWKEFNLTYPEFASDSRNVRLALTSDGFNPFRSMNVSHSTWPVVLMTYNLPPWMCMRPEYFMLSLLIPGRYSPGNNIDIYMQPLIEELKELWFSGVLTYDATSNRMFKMHAALLWTISDFPGYAMLSGWSTKGKFACPCCNYQTWYRYLRYSKKGCYMGHRRFLNLNHPWRQDKNSFDGTTETRIAPEPLSGATVLDDVHDFPNNFGKKQNVARHDGPWRKKSIFFELPYWEHNKICHNLDVMHIEKNICDSILCTLLDVPGKTKDHANARLDLLDMGIRKKLQPKACDSSHKTKFAKACFSMTKEEKDIFCRVFKEVKLPDGSASNISRCVNLKEKKIFGYKSHDAHFIMHYLLQAAVRRTVPKHVAIALIRLGSFFRCLCSKVIKIEDLHRLRSEIAEILCQLERIFPPSFFDVMVHLPIHLVKETLLGGPVHYRWMYPVERYLCRLKSYVRNRSHPEGSIAEGYLAEECLMFCSRYMHDNCTTRFNRVSRNRESLNVLEEERHPIFPLVGQPIWGKKNKKGKIIVVDEVTLNQAHRYILCNCDRVQEFINEHQSVVSSQRGSKKRKWQNALAHKNDFASWFKTRVEDDDSVPNYIKELARGPSNVARTFSGYIINGYRFHTKQRDVRCKTQNHGVTISALTSSYASSRDQNPIVSDVTYYGAIEEIIQLDYYGSFKIVLFKCSWFKVEQDDYGLTRVNFNRMIFQDDPFVMASQVQQVFYVQDPVDTNWQFVMMLPRNLSISCEESTSVDHYDASSNVRLEQILEFEDDFDLSREGVEDTTIDESLDELRVHANPNQEEEINEDEDDNEDKDDDEEEHSDEEEEEEDDEDKDEEEDGEEEDEEEGEE